MFNKLLDHLDFLWAEADLNMGLSVVRTTGSGQNWAPDRPAAVRSASTGIHKIQGYGITGIHEHRDKGTQGYRNTRILEHRDI